uniref:RRM domain-containing protein n=1 Tax=Parastrongyloides trichosuri TaxID=131310 RepID=A0A0N4ZH46_PARTI
MDVDVNDQIMNEETFDDNNNEEFYSLKLINLDTRCSPFDLMQFSTSYGLNPCYVDSFRDGIGIVAFRKMNDLKKFVELLNVTPAIPLLMGGLTSFSIDDTEKNKGRKRRGERDDDTTLSKCFKQDY